MAVYYITDPSKTWRAITTSDTVNMAGGCRAVWVGGAGNVVAINSDNQAITFTAVPAGTLLPISPRRINATSTTATLMIALY